MPTMSQYLRATVSGFIFGQSVRWSGLLELLSSSDRQIVSGYVDDHASYLSQLAILYCSVLVTSSLVIHIAKSSGYVSLTRRQPSNYGWFRYDGNVVGGIIQGTGMAMVNSEPGIVLLRAGMGFSQSTWLLLGGVLGGFGFVTLSGKLKRQLTQDKIRSEETRSAPATKQATSGDFSFVLSLTILLLVLSVISRLSYHDFASVKSWRAAIGGIGIGLSQLTSILLTKGTLGVSSVYPALATHALRLFDKTKTDPGYNPFAFTAGVMLSGAVSRTGRLYQEEFPNMDSGKSTAFFAGLLMIFGARIAGGCTSGHGISGCGLLSTSSCITVIMMIVGIMLRNILKFV